MNVGDRIQVVDASSPEHTLLGTVLSISVTYYGSLVEVKLDNANTSFFYDMRQLQVMSAFNYAPNPVPPAPKPITFRFTKNPVAYVTLVPDGPRWIVRDCHDDQYMGMSYASMEEFLTIHNDSGVYESTGLPPKQCKHQWKERILFISIEDYCALCGEYKARKAS